MHTTPRQTSNSSVSRDRELEKQQIRQFVDQYFIFQDYTTSHPNENITFSEWLDITHHSTDEETCLSRVNVHRAVKIATNMCVAKNAQLQENSNSMNDHGVSSTIATVSSSGADHTILRECTSQINTNSQIINSKSQTQRQSHDNSNKNTTYRQNSNTSKSSISIRSKASDSKSSNSHKSSTHSNIERSRSNESATSSITSSSKLSSSSSSSSSLSSKRTKGDRLHTGTIVIPHPKMISEQDLSYFSLKSIEQKCSWPMEVPIPSESLATFTDLIIQKVDQVCKYLFSPPIPDPSADDETRKRYLFEGAPFSPTIGWSPYQTYCGIDQCTCETDFGIPHFLYDSVSIKRNIPFKTLVDKNSVDEEVIALRESLYTQMKKENAVGRKVWQNGRNRVSTNQQHILI
jgi:hypothetical protein